MTGFAARYFDGRSSSASEVTVTVYADGRVLIHGADVRREIARADLRISSRLGNSARYLYLPDGARCETLDNAAVDTLLPGGGGLVHALERRWGTALLAATLTAAFLYLGFEHVLPAMARSAAHAVPPAMETRMGEESLRVLDHRLLAHTRLTEVERERARAAFARVVSDLDLGQSVRLELRRSAAIGANAMALPSGIVVLTDAMVELAANDEELMGVIAHELGHVHHRHIVRAILQSSVLALLLATLLGDVTAVTGLAASVPTFLMEQRYSRDFEREADAYALAWVRAQDMEPGVLTAMLRRLAEEHGGEIGGPAEYLSTHPSIAERIEALER